MQNHDTNQKKRGAAAPPRQGILSIQFCNGIVGQTTGFRHHANGFGTNRIVKMSPHAGAGEQTPLRFSSQFLFSVSNAKIKKEIMTDTSLDGRNKYTTNTFTPGTGRDAWRARRSPNVFPYKTESF